MTTIVIVTEKINLVVRKGDLDANSEVIDAFAVWFFMLSSSTSDIVYLLNEKMLCGISQADSEEAMESNLHSLCKGRRYRYSSKQCHEGNGKRVWKLTKGWKAESIISG